MTAYCLPSESLEESHSLAWLGLPHGPRSVQSTKAAWVCPRNPWQNTMSPLLRQVAILSEFPGESILACDWTDLESNPASLFLSLSNFG